MNLIYHKNLDQNQWFQQSLSYQLGNVGSEVSRTLNWLNKGKKEHANLAFERALELFDLTVADPKNKKRLKEILRTRELFAEWFLTCLQSEKVADNNWLKYFDAYGYYARLQQNKL